MPAMFGMTSRNLEKALNLPRGDPRMASMFEVHLRAGIVMGVYGILDTIDWWIYVGKSCDCHRRKAEHEKALHFGKHPCISFRDMCTGIDNQRWRFILLEPGDNDWSLRSREEWWMKNVLKCINLVEDDIRKDMR